MSEPLDHDVARDDRRRHIRAQDAVGLQLRRRGESAEPGGGARTGASRPHKHAIAGYAAVRREYPEVAAYIDELEERVRQLLLDAGNAEMAPTHKVSLSAGGLAFADQRLFEPGEMLGVTLTLFPSGRRVASDARVVSANDAPEVASGDRPTYRLVFERMSDADRETLERHVAELLEARPDPDE